MSAFPSCMPSADSRVHFSPSKVTGKRKETMHLESTLSRSSPKNHGSSNNLSRNCPFKDLHATELCTQHACIGSVLLHKIMVVQFLPLVLLLPSPFLCRPLPPLRRRITTGGEGYLPMTSAKFYRFFFTLLVYVFIVQGEDMKCNPEMGETALQPVPAQTADLSITGLLFKSSPCIRN